MEYRLSRCDFQDTPGRLACSFSAMYRVTVVSAEGPTCEMLLCAEHVSESRNVGADVARRHFSELNLSLGWVRLDPVHKVHAASRD